MTILIIAKKDELQIYYEAKNTLVEFRGLVKLAAEQIKDLVDSCFFGK